MFSADPVENCKGSSNAASTWVNIFSIKAQFCIRKLVADDMQTAMHDVVAGNNNKGSNLQLPTWP